MAFFGPGANFDFLLYWAWGAVSLLIVFAGLAFSAMRHKSERRIIGSVALVLAAPGLVMFFVSEARREARNDPKRAAWTRQAAAGFRVQAEQGDAEAQYRIGESYFRGHLVSVDYAEALKWWRKAADQGHSGGQFGLGMIFSSGCGVPKDVAEGYKWWLVAAGQGNRNAADACQQIESGLTPKEREEGQRRARDYRPVGKTFVGRAESAANQLRSKAEGGDIKAQIALGDIYAKGVRVPKNDAEAARWHLKAFNKQRSQAETGDVQAQTELGDMYLHGRGVAKDDVAAAKWWGRAANQGYRDAQVRLGNQLDYLVPIHAPPPISPEEKVESYKWLLIVEAKESMSAWSKISRAEKFQLSPEQIAEGKRRAREFKPVKEAQLDTK